MSINRIESHTVLRGAANADDWLSFIADSSAVFADEQFTHLVIDNASIHHAVREEVEFLLEQFGVKLIFLPPYSPDLNPIEEAFSKFKHLLASVGRALDDIEVVVADALSSITQADCLGYYRFYL